MSKILKELAAATAIAYATDLKTVEVIAVATSKLGDAAWNKLSDPAQDWTNDCIDSLSANRGLLALPDAEPEPEAAPARGRRRSAEEPAASPAPNPVVGDMVTVLTKRGKTITGKVTILEDQGELVMLDDKGEEFGVPLASIESVTVNTPPAAAAPAGRRRVADEGPAEPLTPEVSDTVELVNKRDRTYLGNVIDLDGDTIVIKTVGGEELDFARDSLKSCVVKVKNAGKGIHPDAGAAAPARGRGLMRRAPAAGAADTPATRTRASNPGSVSVGTRIRELVLDNPGITEEKVGAKLDAEGLKFAPASLSMNYKDTIKFLELLKARKMLA